MGHHKHSIFISSTSEDMTDIREAVYEAIRSTNYLDPVGMEYFLADPRSPRQLCEDKVKECSLFLGIIGDRRGWEPEGDPKNSSITQIEYETAISNNISPFMAVLPEGALAPSGQEAVKKSKRQQQFRQFLMNNHGVILTYDNPDKLAAQLVISVTNMVMTNLFDQKDEAKSVEPTPDEIVASRYKAIEQAVEDHLIDPKEILSEGKEIDPDRLIEEFWKKAEQTSDQALEYYKYVGALAFNNHTQKALQAYKRAVELDPDDPDGWNQLGLIQYRIGDLIAAEKSFKKVLSYGNNYVDRRAIAIAHGNLGRVYNIWGAVDKAEDAYVLALKLFKQLGCKNGKATCHNNLGLINLDHRKFEQAEVFFQTALTLYKTLSNKEGMAECYGNLSILYKKQEKVDLAVKMLDQAVKLDEELENKTGLASNYGSYGLLYLADCEFEKAEKAMFKSLSYHEELGDKNGMAINLNNLGELYRNWNKLNKAVESLLKSLELFQQLENKAGMAAVYAILGNIYEAKDHLSKSEIAQLESFKLHEQVDNKENMAKNLCNLGKLCTKKGDIQAACNHWWQALDLLTEIGMKREMELVQGWLEEAGCSEKE